MTRSPLLHPLRRGLPRLALAWLALAAGGADASQVPPHDPHDEHEHRERPLSMRAAQRMRAFQADREPSQPLQASSLEPCLGGFAGTYPCENVDLLAFLPTAQIGGGSTSDLWGWTDAQTGREYVLIGRTFGTSFVDATDPVNPVYLGELPTHGVFGSSWRDIKVYADHAFIVSEALNHGMQVFDLRLLRNVALPPVTFSETAHYDDVRSAHNIAINEDTGFAYVVGSNLCSGGLHFVDIADPANPVGAGCADSDGYTHDTQCVVYQGPDTAHQGSEVCFSSNEDTLTIVDVTNKASPVQLSRTGYPGVSYTHQGWLTEDHVHFLLGDEGDEQGFGHGTRTRIFDVSDLSNPVVVGIHDASTAAIDHNLYVRDGYVYQANYRAGLRILDLADVSSGTLVEVASFDIYPADDAAAFNAAWSVYPYFLSGVVAVSGIEQGLFLLDPLLPSPPPQVPSVGPGGVLALALLLLATARRVPAISKRASA